MVVLSISQVAQATPVDKAELEEIRRNLVLPCSPYINNSSPVSPIQSSNNRIILNSVILHSSWQSWMWFVLLPFIMNLQNLDRIRLDQDFWTRSNTSSISQICDGKLLAEAGFSMVNLENTIRVSQICHGKWLAETGFSMTNLENLDRIRHNQGFPKFLWTMAVWEWVFRDEFGKWSGGRVERGRPPRSRNKHAYPAGA